MCHCWKLNQHTISTHVPHLSRLHTLSTVEQVHAGETSARDGTETTVTDDYQGQSPESPGRTWHSSWRCQQKGDWTQSAAGQAWEKWYIKHYSYIEVANLILRLSRRWSWTLLNRIGNCRIQISKKNCGFRWSVLIPKFMLVLRCTTATSCDIGYADNLNTASWYSEEQWWLL